jgi:hypothetical protein
MAAAALRAIDWRARWSAADEAEHEQLRREWRSEQQAGAIEAHLHVWYCPPKEIRDDVPHPAHRSRKELLELSRRDRLAVAYARLLAVRDLRSLSPLVTRHESNGSPLDSMLLYFDYEDISPVSERHPPEGEVPPLSPTKFPPDLAEMLWKLVQEDLAPPMEANQAVALLCGADSWRLDELPPGLNAATLRKLDADGLVEVRCWIRQNMTTDRDHPAWQERSEGGWFSPVLKPEIAGGWDQLFDDIAPPWRPGAEVRLTERGKVAARSPQPGEPEEWIRAGTASRASGLSADTIRKRAEKERWRIRKSGSVNLYLHADLKRTWPDLEFRADKGGK